MAKQYTLKSIKDITLNPDNPRVIKDEAYKKLVKSLQDFPQMLELRPIVIDEDGVILGGNMRFKACIEAGMQDVPVVVASDLTDEQKREFIVKDNLPYGEWDWEALTDWDKEELSDWGLEVSTVDIDETLENFFNAPPPEDVKQQTTNKIVLEYSEEDYNNVLTALKKYTGSKESIIYNLLMA